MATTTDPDNQQTRNPGQRHAEDTFDFDKLEQELANTTDRDDLDSLGELSENQQRIADLRERRASRKLAAQEEAAGGATAGGSDPAKGEQYPTIPFNDKDRGDEDIGAPKKKGIKKLRRWLIAASAIMAILGGGGAFYFAATNAEGSIAQQIGRQTRQRVAKYYREAILPHFAKYMAAEVLGNALAMDDCKNDTGPELIVTKDCFYRHKKDYPDSFMGRFYKALKDAHIEAKLLDGIDISFNPSVIVDPATGRRGPLWIVTTPAGSVPIDPANPELGFKQVFETREFDGTVDILIDPKRPELGTTKVRSFRALGEVRGHLIDNIEKVTKIGAIQKLFLLRYFEKWHLPGCRVYCDWDRQDRKALRQMKRADFKEAIIGRIALYGTGKTSIGFFLACFFSRQPCLESDSGFQKRFGEQLAKTSAAAGKELKFENLLKVADAVKKEKTVAAYVLKKFAEKLASHLGPTIGSSIINGVPIAGQIIYSAIVAWKIIEGVTIAYIVHDAMSGPTAQAALTYIKAEGFVAAYNLVTSGVDERLAVGADFNSEAQNAAIDQMSGYSRSKIQQAQYGNPEGFKNYEALFNNKAYAAAADEYPNVCNSDGDIIPANKLVCPEWQFDYTPPVMAAAQSTALPPGESKDLTDEIAGGVTSVSDVLNAPFDAVTDAALETEAGKATLAAAQSALDPLMQPIVNQIFSPPFESAEELKGAKLYDAAWAGSDWAQNDMVRGGLAEDGTPKGWGRVLSDQELAQQDLDIQQEDQQTFASLPLWDRVLSTDYSQSFVSQFAFAAPTEIHSPFQFMASIFSPLTGARFAAISKTASAATSTNFFHIPAYGASLQEIQNAPLISLETNSCPNDRTPPKIGDPGTIDRHLGRAEYTSFNSCVLQAEALAQYSANFTNEPVVTEASSSEVLAGQGAGSGTVTGTLGWPIAEADYGGDTSCFGEARSNSQGDPYNHAGIDLFGKLGEGQTKILAADGGKVVTVARDPSRASGTGLYVVIEHTKDGNTKYTGYMHLDSIDPAIVGPGTLVSKGQVLGFQGNTGDSSGTHLHFEYGTKPYSNYYSNLNPLASLPFSGAHDTNTSCPRT